MISFGKTKQLGVARLTPSQAVHILQLWKTRTKRTAGLLAVEYGVTAKAIRDIWMLRSWAQNTWPNWNT